MTSAAIRVGGRVAVIGGGLRIASSLATPESDLLTEILYLVIDLAILFGLMAIYARDGERLGRVGLAGFVLAAAGAATIAGPDASIGLLDVYTVGSLAIGIGVVLMSAAAWPERVLPRWIAASWIGSTTSGIAGTLAGLEPLYTASGILFGAALSGAGWRVARSRRDHASGERLTG